MPEEIQKIYDIKISPFLRNKMKFLKRNFGDTSQDYQAIARQYLLDPSEKQIDFQSERQRHYEADLLENAEGTQLKGVERLYRKVALIDLTTTCIAHCRWCLRACYPRFTLKKEEISRASKYIGNPKNRKDITEVLVTGGDPLLFPDLLRYTIDSIAKLAPNIRIIRIGSRLPVQDPGRINKNLLSALTKPGDLRIEIGTQINHPIEIWPECREAYYSLQQIGITIYNQQVLLRGVNNNLDILVKLYNELRDLGIETHYMFHCIPMRGMSHHRTSVEEGLELIKGLTMSGRISGRSKPMYTAMTDVGKVTLYEGVVLDKKGDMILLQTRYLKEDRLRWNPSWKMPDSAIVDDDGYLRVWYQDGKVHDEDWPSTFFFTK